MKTAKQIAMVILALVTIPVYAQGPNAPWPPDVAVSPQNPGVLDEVTLTFSDTWPRNCYPLQSEQRHAVEVIGNSIYVTIYTGERFACLDRPSPWQIERSVGPLDPGCYDVYVALEAWTWADEPFTLVTSFCVEDDSSSNPPQDSARRGQFELCVEQEDPFFVSGMLNDKNCKSFNEPWLTSMPPKPTWAPLDAVVTKIEYRLEFEANPCSDYEISLDRDQDDTTAPVVLYDNLGGDTDGGYDDDPEDDHDIELDWRYTNAFNGQSVHQNWTFCITNTITEYPIWCILLRPVKILCLRIYWEIPDDQSNCGVKAGDRVVLLTDQPRGAFGLEAGMEGTVICTDGDDPDLPIFVSWDNWANGRNSDGYCDAPPLAYTPYSGWWVGCQDIVNIGDGSQSGGDGRPGGGGSGPGGTVPTSTPVFRFGNNCAPLVPDPTAPAWSKTYIGSMMLSINANFRGRYSATVDPVSSTDRQWTAWVEPEILGPGQVTAALRVRVQNLNLADVGTSGNQVQVAVVHVYVEPVF